MSNEVNMDKETRLDNIMDEFSNTPLDILDDKDKREVCEIILTKKMQSEESAKGDRRDLLVSSLGCILISLVALIPIILPVMVIDDMNEGLTAVSAMTSLILFIVGYKIAPYMGTNKWLTAFTITGVTLAIALISVFTGG
jgi:VIT1/CCC1 family predicted Fe2+/Mn2+ transporter